jgi:hypothetical protein
LRSQLRGTPGASTSTMKTLARRTLAIARASRRSTSSIEPRLRIRRVSEAKRNTPFAPLSQYRTVTVDGVLEEYLRARRRVSPVSEAIARALTLGSGHAVAGVFDGEACAAAASPPLG